MSIANIFDQVEDIPNDFAEVINFNFWDLLDDMEDIQND